MSKNQGQGPYGNSNPSLFRVRNSTLTQGTGGITAYRGNAFEDRLDEITITGNTLTASGVINVDSRNDRTDADTVAIRVANNTVTGSTSTSSAAFTIRDDQLQPSRLTGNTGSSNKINAIRVWGTLVEDWTMPTTGLPYIITNGVSLSVAKGATLAVPAGVVVKFDDNASLSVNGSLVVTGTTASPVVFTSIKDDTAGGDTNGDGTQTTPTPGSWNGVSVASAGSLKGDYLELRYAGAAFTTAGTLELKSSIVRKSARGVNQSGGASSIELDISNAPVLSLSSGSAELRGRYSGELNSAIVTACSWQSMRCSVDASHFDWGTRSDPGGAGLTCGSVSYSPWLGMPEGTSLPLWATPNCDGSRYTPDAEIATSSSRASRQVAGWSALCGVEGYESACEVAQIYNRCLSAARDLGLSNIAVSFPGAAVTPNDWNVGMADTLSDVVKESTDSQISTAGHALGFTAKLVSLFGILTSVKSSYDRCAPGEPPR